MAASYPPLTFALIPKGLSCEDDGFFEPILRGCRDRAEEEENRSVRCECVPRPSFEVTQGTVIENIVNNTKNNTTDTTLAATTYDGIAISVADPDDVQDPIAAAMADGGLPVVTVDSDASASSSRLAYIGTDNIAMGREMARLLLQLRPQGGTYVLVSARSPNLRDRERGIREAFASGESSSSRWVEAADGSSPLYTSDPADVAALLRQRPDVRGVLPTFLNPMGNATAWRLHMGPYRHNVTIVGTDWTDGQLQLIREGHVHGLVGQLPYEMGRQVATTLLDWHEGTTARHNDNSTSAMTVDAGGNVESVIFGTNLIDMVRVPLDLPPIDFDYNYLGNLAILGYLAFGSIALMSLGAAIWSYLSRTKYVVRASQPIFLYIICLGTLIFSSSILLMGMDDENFSQKHADRACAALPWVFNIGFVLIFSALFSKTWRINRLLHQSNKFKRLKVTTKDVILPLVLLLLADIIILSCWTALEPLEFRRLLSSSTDLWNRVVSSNGHCRMPEGRSALEYMVMLGIINGGSLLLAMYQAYQARDIQTEFAESKYIAIVFASLAEGAVVGLPVLLLDREDPRVTYVEATILCTLLCVAILGFIFVPKILHQRERDAEEAKQKDKKRIHVTGLNNPAPTPLGSSSHSEEEDPERNGMKVYFWKKLTHREHSEGPQSTDGAVHTGDSENTGAGAAGATHGNEEVEDEVASHPT